MTPSRCLRTVMLLSDYLDGDLNGPACVRLQVHLAACPRCVRTYRTLKRTIELFKTYASMRSCPRRIDPARDVQRLTLLD